MWIKKILWDTINDKSPPEGGADKVGVPAPKTMFDRYLAIRIKDATLSLTVPDVEKDKLANMVRDKIP
jgi:rRNA maturation protein Nop10